MQHINFGRIEDLHVRYGEPVFDPLPRMAKDLNLGGDNGPRPELERENFELKQEHVELFNTLSRIDEGRVQLIEVKHGLPFRLTVPVAV